MNAWLYMIDKIGRQRPGQGGAMPMSPGDQLPTFSPRALPQGMGNPGQQGQGFPMFTGGGMQPQPVDQWQTGGQLPPQAYGSPMATGGGLQPQAVQFPMQTGGPGQMTQAPQWQTGGGLQPQQVNRPGNAANMLNQFRDPVQPYAFGRGSSYR